MITRNWARITSHGILASIYCAIDEFAAWTPADREFPSRDLPATSTSFTLRAVRQPTPGIFPDSDEREVRMSVPLNDTCGDACAPTTPVSLLQRRQVSVRHLFGWHRWPQEIVRAFLLALLAWCGSEAAATPPAYDHVVIVVEENHWYEQIIGSNAAPYINSLLDDGVLFTNMYGLTHPSQPNYMHLYSGMNQNLFTDFVPVDRPPLNTPNFGAALRAHGLTFGAYSDGLPAVGSLVADDEEYVRRHAPWTYWQDDSASPGPNTVPGNLHRPFTQFPTDAAGFAALPTVTFVIPDNKHNMHSASILDADTWLDANLSEYRDWAAENNSLMVVVWDEDNYQQDNQIPMIFSGANLRPGVVAGRYTLHSLLRTLEDMYDLPHSGLASAANPVYGAFVGEEPRALTTRTFQQGKNAYASSVDTELRAYRPTTRYDTLNPSYVSADLFKDVEGTQPSQLLIRFDDLVGSAPGQIPPNARIESAQLVFHTSSERGGANSTSSIRVHRMLRDWSASDTWDSLVNGVGTDNVEAAADYDFLTEPNVVDAMAIFMVTDTVQQWVNGQNNLGWVLTTSGVDDWRMRTNDAPELDLRPFLEIKYWNTGLVGDFNTDGQFDVRDVELLQRAARGEINDSVFNVDGSLQTDQQDIAYWLHDIRQTWYGDTDLDGVFDSLDLVQVFIVGEYEDGVDGNSTWGEGDWDGDGDFTTLDFVIAFQDGGYEAGNRSNATFVPEPATDVWILASLTGLMAFRTRPTRR